MAESSHAGDNQFAGLVEAASAAADQEVVWSQNDGANGPARQYHAFDGSHPPPGNPNLLLDPGRREASLRSVRNDGESEAFTRPYTRKRKRGSDSIDVGDHLAAEQAADRPASQHSPAPRTPTAVHSAAALFRCPSTSSKKYTRPPMSKLFSSLQLLPEDFLRLQSAAKAYMLDDDHPERRQCVGQRGKTDLDMIKLKIWNCVQEFLHQEDNGERFFGAKAPKADRENGARSMTWPEDAQQIIKACVPLLRRMVTNERQRQYAVETRKGGAQSKREGHDPDTKQPRKGTAGATIDATDNSDTVPLERMDIFGDGLFPGADEASEWYNVYNSDGDLDKISLRSGFPRGLFLAVICNIDGHCRLYHGGSTPQCSDSCRTRLVGRLLESRIYQQQAPAGNPSQTVQELFDTVLAHLMRIRYWKFHSGEDTASSTAASTAPARVVSSTNHSDSWKNAVVSNRSNGVGPQGPNLSSSPQLLIYIVHQNKCVLPCFDIPFNNCPNLDALRMQIQKHYGIATLQEKRVTPLPEATFKVWLPDGLIRVEDDGQWMVAVLSADTVEWMGGRIRVLLET